MKLKAKGKSDFVTMTKVPEEAAGAEARVVMRAFREAAEGLLALSVTPDLSETVRKGILTNYLGLKKLHSEVETDMEKLAFILHVVEQKVKAI